MWRSNTAGRKGITIGCRRWQPISFADKWPGSSRAAPLRQLLPKPATSTIPIVINVGIDPVPLLGCAGLRLADALRRIAHFRPLWPNRNMRVGIGDSQRATAELALSEEERGRLYDGIMRIADAWVADVPAPDVAGALSSGVPLHDLPTGMAQEIPQVEGHKFVKFEDRIVVVNARSGGVVAMITRDKLLLYPVSRSSFG